MIKTSITILIVVALALIQIELMPIFAIYGVWPNTILIVALLLLFVDFEHDAFILAGLGGLILDLAGPWVFGVQAIALIIFLFVNKYLVEKYLNNLNQWLIGIIITVNAILYSLFFNLIFHNQPYLSLIFIGGLYSMALAQVIFIILTKISNRRAFAIRVEK